MLNTKAAVIKEVRSQLSRFLLSNRHTIDWLENESKNESEDPIEKLAEKIGYNSTADLLHGEFRDCVKFVGKNIIEATPKLYDTPELQHIISLQKRT
uniref:Uncharacterized protein n=1 Tax=Panagrolaimus sp. ES5 TaxID=591445 RepID=A0AC34G5S8_9BILA